MKVGQPCERSGRLALAALAFCAVACGSAVPGPDGGSGGGFAMGGGAGGGGVVPAGGGAGTGGGAGAAGGAPEDGGPPDGGSGDAGSGSSVSGVVTGLHARGLTLGLSADEPGASSLETATVDCPGCRGPLLPYRQVVPGLPEHFASGLVAMAVNSATRKAYFVNGAGDLWVVDNERSEVSGQVSLMPPPWACGGLRLYESSALEVNPSSGRVYALLGSCPWLAILDASGEVAQVALPSAPRWMAVNHRTDRVYITTLDTSAVAVIDGATRAVSSIPVGLAPGPLAVDEVHDRVYVRDAAPSGAGARLTVIEGLDGSTRSLSLPPDHGSGRLAVDVALDRLYLPLRDEAHADYQQMAIVDLSRVTVTSVDAGTFLPSLPGDGLVVDQTTHQVFLDGYTSLVVFDGLTLQSRVLVESGIGYQFSPPLPITRPTVVDEAGGRVFGGQFAFDERTGALFVTSDLRDGSMMQAALWDAGIVYSQGTYAVEALRPDETPSFQAVWRLPSGPDSVPFSFASQLGDGQGYRVGVLSQPAGQLCTVDGGTTVALPSGGRVEVSCTDTSVLMTGTVSGLTGPGLELRQAHGYAAGGSTIRLPPGATGFTFADPVRWPWTPLTAEQAAVEIGAQPSGQTCTLSTAASTPNGSQLLSVECR